VVGVGEFVAELLQHDHALKVSLYVVLYLIP
jgi:hypothetical protein